MISFARKYPVDLKNSAGVVIPTRLELSVSGPVDSRSGMILNLVDMDQEARRQILQFEKQKFEKPESALAWIRDQWVLSAQKLGVRVTAVQLRGRFGRVRWGFSLGGTEERWTTWTSQSFKVDGATGESGFVFATGLERRHVREALRSLRDLKFLNVESLGDWVKKSAKIYPGLLEVGFQRRKSRSRIRIQISN